MHASNDIHNVQVHAHVTGNDIHNVQVHAHVAGNDIHNVQVHVHNNVTASHIILM